jgi:phenylalanyl-tRNA synthetase alpha chain
MVEMRAQEQQILLALKKLDGKGTVEQLLHKSKLSDAAVMRAALTLQEKDLVKIHAEMETIVKLTAEGENHAEHGLPERRLIKAVMALGGNATLDEAATKADLEKQFVQIALGWTQRKKWLTYDSKQNRLSAAFEPEEETD